MLDFENIVDKFHEGLFRFALSLTRNEDQASDLTQQTYFMLVSKGHQLRDVSKVKSWLFTTLHRQFLGQKRFENRFPHSELEASGADLPGVTPNLVNQLDGATVMQALQQVDELHRAPLTLFYLQDHSYQEIATILDVPIGTVMSRLSRGKEQLRTLLAKGLSDAPSKIVPMPPQASRRTAP